MNKHILWKSTLCVLLLAVMSLLAACGYDDAVILSLPAYDQKEFYTEGGFQDFTDYGIYRFPLFDKGKLEENLYFTPITDADAILPYIENFETWITEGSELSDHYDFDKACIGDGDYVFIDTKEGTSIGNGGTTYGAFDNYSVYFFDADTWTLHYFHSNI